MDVPLGSLSIAGDLAHHSNLSSNEVAEVWAKPVPIPPGHHGHTAVAVVLFNRGPPTTSASIVLDFGLFGAPFKNAKATMFDVIKGQDVEDSVGSYTSKSIVGHGCEFLVAVFSVR